MYHIKNLDAVMRRDINGNKQERGPVMEAATQCLEMRVQGWMTK